VSEKENSQPSLRQQTMQIASNGDSALRVLQITDCHLGEQVGESLAGMDTDASLDFVIELLLREQGSTPNEGALAVDLLLATGDLSNHGTAAAYQRLDQKLQPLGVPMAWLPGNHDIRDLMIDTVGPDRLPRLIRLGNWAICMLDSAVPGKVGGELGPNELDGLQSTLEALPADCHIVVCLHHQPVPVGSYWLDQQQVVDSEQLFEVLGDEPRLRAIVWGHVHQEFSGSDARLPDVQLMASPSTCIQFAPDQPDFTIDAAMPGYRWFDLHPDGTLRTGVSRVENVALDLDMASSGY
jgi:Icc protein